MTHESNSLLKLHYRPIMCSLATPSTKSLKHVLLGFSEPRYLTCTLKAYKDKMPVLWEVNTILGARFPTQLTWQQGCHYVSSGQLSKKTHYWTCWSLTTWSHTSVAEKETSTLEILFSSLMSGSSFEKPNSWDQPFYLSSLCNSRWKKYMLGLPSLSPPHPWLQMLLMWKEG